MTKKEIEKRVKEIVFFRSKMGLKLSKKKVKDIWGKEILNTLSRDIWKELGDSDRSNENVIKKKINIAKDNLDSLLVLDMVKFIGISGSVAAGFAQEDDDIDLFIVVKNNCAWVYRGVISIRNIFNHRIRTSRDGNMVKDLFCINFIVEERGLKLDNDLFNFHELMYLIPIYSAEYIDNIYMNNLWLYEVYGFNVRKVNSKLNKYERVNVLVNLLNVVAFILQLLFMVFTGHRPEINRLLDNYKKGKIEFFPKDFKHNVLNESMIDHPIK